MLRLIKASVVGALFLGVFLVSAGQQGPTPQEIPLFGIPPERLAQDGVYAYPAGSGDHMTREQAEVFARGKSLREDKFKGVMIVNASLPGVPFEGLAWVFRWDVDGKSAIWPGDSQNAPGTEYVYTYDLTFVDAMTGEFLLGAAESTLAH